jgi:hypothetical protein
MSRAWRNGKGRENTAKIVPVTKLFDPDLSWARDGEPWQMNSINLLKSESTTMPQGWL